MRPAHLVVSLFLVLAGAQTAQADLDLGDLLVTDLARRAVFQVDPETGDRTVLSGCIDEACTSLVGSGPALSSPTGLARLRSRDLMTPIFVTDTLSDSILRLDPSTGARSVVSSNSVGTGPSLITPVAITVEPSGQLLVVDESRSALLRVDTVTGNRTLVSGCPDGGCPPILGGGPAFEAPHDVVINAFGSAAILDTDIEAIFNVDLASGDRTFISSSSVGSGPEFHVPRNIARAPDGTLYVSDSGASATEPGSIYRIDPDTGERTIISSESVGGGRNLEVPVGLTLDSFGQLLVLDFAPGLILSIDPLSGMRNIISSSRQGTGLSFSAPSSIVSLPIPEPGTGLLFGLGIAILARYERVRGQWI